LGISVTVRDSAFTANPAVNGGGVYNALATLDVPGCVFSCGSSASDSGSAIYKADTATIQECTLSGNTAASGTLTIDDSSVLNNVAPLGADLYTLDALTLDDSAVGMIRP
jgi:ABC-type phosphate transport system substrate-binding protein